MKIPNKVFWLSAVFAVACSATDEGGDPASGGPAPINGGTGNPLTMQMPRRAELLSEVIEQTAFVAQGTVSAVRYEYTAETGPWTVTTLSDVKAQLGTPPAQVTIRQMGGPLPDGRTLIVSTATDFEMGKRYLVFYRNTSWNISPVVGQLALRQEQVAGNDVLVDHRGSLLMGVESNEIMRSAQAFNLHDRYGTAPRALGDALSMAPRALTAARFVTLVGDQAKTLGRTISGPFSELPLRRCLLRPVSATPTVPMSPLAVPADSQAGSETDLNPGK